MFSHSYPLTLVYITCIMRISNVTTIPRMPPLRRVMDALLSSFPVPPESKAKRRPGSSPDRRDQLSRKSPSVFVVHTTP